MQTRESALFEPVNSHSLCSKSAGWNSSRTLERGKSWLARIVVKGWTACRCAPSHQKGQRVDKRGETKCKKYILHEPGWSERRATGDLGSLLRGRGWRRARQRRTRGLGRSGVAKGRFEKEWCLQERCSDRRLIKGAADKDWVVGPRHRYPEVNRRTRGWIALLAYIYA